MLSEEIVSPRCSSFIIKQRNNSTESAKIKFFLYTGFWWCNLRESINLKGPGVDGRILLRWNFGKVGRGCDDWMELAQDRDRWRALVSTVMNFRVP